MAAVTQNPTPQELDTAIRHWDIQVRQSIRDGNIVSYFARHRRTVRDVWKHNVSADPQVQAVFARKTFLEDFINSWPDHQQPTFAAAQLAALDKFDAKRAAERAARKEKRKAVTGVAAVPSAMAAAAPAPANPVPGGSKPSAVAKKSDKRDDRGVQMRGEADTATVKVKYGRSTMTAKPAAVNLAARSSKNKGRFLGPGYYNSDDESNVQKFQDIDGSSSDSGSSSGNEQVPQPKARVLIGDKTESRPRKQPQARNVGEEADVKPAEGVKPPKKQYNRKPIKLTGVFYTGEEACTRCRAGGKLCEQDGNVGELGSCAACRRLRQSCSRVVPKAERPPKPDGKRRKDRKPAKSKTHVSDSDAETVQKEKAAPRSKTTAIKAAAATGRDLLSTPPPVPNDEEQTSGEESMTAPSERPRQQIQDPVLPSHGSMVEAMERWGAAAAARSPGAAVRPGPSGPAQLEVLADVSRPPSPTALSAAGIRPPDNATFASVNADRQEMTMEDRLTIMERRLERLAQLNDGLMSAMEGRLSALTRLLDGSIDFQEGMTRLERQIQTMCSDQGDHAPSGEDQGNENATEAPLNAVTPSTHAPAVASTTNTPALTDIPAGDNQDQEPSPALDWSGKHAAPNFPAAALQDPSAPPSATTTPEPVEREPLPPIPSTPAVNVVTPTPENSQDAPGNALIPLLPSTPLPLPHRSPPGCRTRSRTRSQSAAPPPLLSPPPAAGPSHGFAADLPRTPAKRKAADDLADDVNQEHKKRK